MLVDLQAIFETSAIECYNTAALQALDDGDRLPGTVRAVYVTEATRHQSQLHDTVRGTNDPCGKISVQDGDLLVARPIGATALTIQVIPGGADANLYIAIVGKDEKTRLLPFTGDDLYRVNHALDRWIEEGGRLDRNLVRFRRQATDVLSMVAEEPEHFEPSLALAVLIEQMTGSFECIAWDGDHAEIVNKILADRIIADFPQELAHVAAQVFPSSSLREILGFSGHDGKSVCKLEDVGDAQHQRWMQILPALTSACDDEIAVVDLSGKEADRLKQFLSRDRLTGKWVEVVQQRILARMAQSGEGSLVSVQFYAAERNDILMVRYRLKDGDERALACAWPSISRRACIQLEAGEAELVEVDRWIERVLAISPEEGLSTNALAKIVERHEAAFWILIGQSFLDTRSVVSRMLWKFPGGVLRACEGASYQAARSRAIGTMG